MKIIYVSIIFILLIALAQASSSWQNRFRYPRYNQINSKCGKRKRNLDTRRCFRQCTTDSDCRSSKRKCLCDGECGLSCVRVTQMCHKIGEFPNGHVTYSPDNYFGSQLIYSCNTGYTLIGDKVRTCEGDGWWSGQSPSCVKDSFCETSPPLIPNSIPNIQINMAKFKLGTEVEYQCDIGYAASGSIKKSICQENGKWSEINLVCNKINCGQPTDLQNGYIISNDNSYLSVIEYRCNEGFQLKHGNVLRECLAGGIWSGKKPSCETIDCGPPPYVHKTYPAYNSTLFNSEVIYHCISEQYEMKSQNHMRCLASGTWSTNQIECIEKTCKIDPPENGFIVNSTTIQTFSIGSIIEFACFDNYNLIGSSKLTCLNTLQWSDNTPKCEIEKYCPLFESPENSFIATTNKPFDSGYPVDTKIIFNCLPKYELLGSSVIWCGNNGKWDKDLPICKEKITRIKCVVEPTPSIILLNETQELDDGESISYSCQQNILQATCYNGSLIFNCNMDEKPLSCPSPDKIQNGYIKIGSYQNGSKAFYVCFNGYELKESDGEIQCINGTWVGNTAICTKVVCPHPGTLTNGRILYVGQLGEYSYQPYMIGALHNRQIKFECNDGYTLVGLNGATCINGQWKPGLDTVRCVKDKYFMSNLLNETLDRPKIKRKRKIARKRFRNKRTTTTATISA